MGRMQSTMRPVDETSDPGMVAQPLADPGYAMPNPPIENLNSMEGVEVSGWLPAVTRALQVLGVR